MIDIQIEASDLVELQKRLDKLGMPELYKPSLELIGRSIMGKVKPYPPATDANRPPYPYYERGRGTWTSEGYNTESSERLGQKWYQRTFPSYVEVGNQATYAGYVHGPNQVAIHGERGWKRLLDVATTELPELLKKIADQITRIWEGRQ